MASTKRAAPTESGSRKKARVAATGNSLKSTLTARHDAATPKDKPKRKPTSTHGSSSVLKLEENAFPRGGANALTPLEKKKIQIEATQDVLYEHSGAKKRPSKEDYNLDSPDGSGTEAERAKSKSTKRSKRSKLEKKVRVPDDEESHIKIEGLSYKRLVPGSIILGQVASITSRDVTVALPNNIAGYVSITQVSEQVSQKVEKLLAKSDDEDTDNEEQAEVPDIELKALFRIGQYLRTIVTSTEDDGKPKPGSRPRHKIQLSVKPEDTNKDLAVADLVVGSMLSASIRSIEDHGLVMDLGFGSALSGFLPFKEIGNLCKSELEIGMVLLCLVASVGDNHRIIKLSADHTKAGSMRRATFVTETPTIDSLLPGTAVEILLTDVSVHGITGKVMGMLDVTADLIHSGAALEDITQRYKVGSKVKARVLYTCPTSNENKLGVSLLEHVIKLAAPTSIAKLDKQNSNFLPISHIVEQAQVTRLRPGVGLFMDVGTDGISGFAHISRLSDQRIDNIAEDSGHYKVGSKHRARVVGYNEMDGMYLLSLEDKVLNQPFLRIEDVHIGQTVKGKVDRIVLNPRGVGGVLVNLAEGISGLVPEIHLADAHLQHPERKFREGLPVTARVLSTDLEKRLIRLTLKKSLLNSDAKLWENYDDIEEGDQSIGTIINILQSGAVVQFYGNVRAFLPAAEMSDAYIADASEHFRLGQVVTVRVLSVQPQQQKMMVTCRDPTLSAEQQESLAKLQVGALVTASVIEKSEQDLVLTLDGSGLRANLTMEQLSDASRSKNAASLNRIRAGQKLQDLVVLEKRPQRHAIILSNKPSLVKAARAGLLVSRFRDILEEKEVHGFVRNITIHGVYVQFGGGLVGLLLKSQIEEVASKQPDFGLRIGQSITAKVLSIDHSDQRFLLTQRGQQVASVKSKAVSGFMTGDVVNSIDDQSKTITDYAFGKATRARITSVKETQLNVQLADNVQGRIDVSEVFNDWKSIKDKKRPLRSFKSKQIVDVHVLGVHDARSHRFLPITHRVGKVPVFELTMKNVDGISTEADVLSLDKIKEDSEWIAFINNISDKCVWVSLSPNVRGRIDFMDLTGDVSQLRKVDTTFPIGSAIRVRIKSIDIAANRLDLTVASLAHKKSLDLETVNEGTTLPGRIVRVDERQLVVQLSDTLTGVVGLTDLADDYDQIDLAAYNKNDIVRVCVTDVEPANKRLYLSLRPSKVMSSALRVKDRHIANIAELKVGEVVRGFIKNVTDQGVFVALGPKVTGFVRVSDLSDAFIKDWKSTFELDQLLRGKVTSIDEELSHVQLSLKDSVLDKNYIPPLTFNAVEVGQIVTGKVRKVETFGVFIVVDNSHNVSGLCHRSEIADGHIDDVKSIYGEGDRVKAKILKVDVDKRRINFGLKASYFQDDADDDGASVISDLDELERRLETEATLDDRDEDMMDGGVVLDTADTEESDVDPAFDEDSSVLPAATNSGHGLSAGGFDWSGNDLHRQTVDSEDSDQFSDDGIERKSKKKKRRKPEIKVDRTGDLDRFGPQSVADYERQLLGQPNDSSLWIQYMAFQLQLNEVDQARELAQRALRSIHIREEDEKLNVWVALLNLENAYGNDESLESAFKQACRYNDTSEMHQRLASIYIDSGKLDKADELFEAMMKNKTITAAHSFWVNYATFLMTTRKQGHRARALLPRAMQSVPKPDHLRLTTSFGSLEFTSPGGDPERGRTVFEGVLASFPNRGDLWDMFVDTERSHGDAKNVRSLFERMSKQKMKKRRANFVFRRWLEFETDSKDAKGAERVKATQAQWEKDHQRDDARE